MAAARRSHKQLWNKHTYKLVHQNLPTSTLQQVSRKKCPEPISETACLGAAFYSVTFNARLDPPSEFSYYFYLDPPDSFTPSQFTRRSCMDSHTGSLHLHWIQFHIGRSNIGRLSVSPHLSLRRGPSGPRWDQGSQGEARRVSKHVTGRWDS